MIFENSHKKSIKGDGFLTDLFNTSTKFAPAVLGQIKDNKDNLLSIIDESSEQYIKKRRCSKKDK